LRFLYQRHFQPSDRTEALALANLERPSSSMGLMLIEARESLQSPPQADHTSLQALFDVRRFY